MTSSINFNHLNESGLISNPKRFRQFEKLCQLMLLLVELGLSTVYIMIIYFANYIPT